MLNLRHGNMLISVYIVIALLTVGFASFMVMDKITDNVQGGSPIIVDINGNGNYTSIQNAIDNATNGDTIFIWAGTYNENVIVNKSVSLMGNGTDQTIVDGSFFGVVFNITANWVQLFDMTVTGGGTGPEDTGISVYNTTYVYFDRINSTNNGYMGLSIKNSTEIMAMNSTFDWNSGYQTQIKYSNNITFFNCSYDAASTTGIAAIDSNEVAVIASKIITTVSSTSVLVGMNSHVDMVVVDFNQSLVTYLDNQSTLKVMNRLSVQIIDSVTLQPIKDAAVNILDAFDVQVGSYTTTPEGLVDGLILDFYQGHDNNSNQNDLDLNERIYFSPHNITASNGGYITGYANPEPNMNTSRHVVIALQKVPVEYIVIQNQGGTNGLNVTNSHYPLGATDTFHAAGYHTSYGFVKDISVNWIANDPGIATVSSPGKSSTFTASSVNSGQVRITVWSGGLTSFVDIFVDQAGIDYVTIQDMDYPFGGWIDSRNYDLGMNQTFYAAGYNNTAGYLGPVFAAWSSSNPNVGTVTDTGTSTLFQASAIAHGTTIVTATGTNFSNSTGVLTVNPPSVDYIKIESLQDSTGNPITTGAYLVGETDQFYCAGYNTTTNSFVKDVPATWSSSNTGVGTVTSPGTFTIFSTVGSGITRVDAAYGGMSYRTDDLTVSQQTIIDISINSIIEPPSPALDSSNITIRAVIENLGNTDLQNVTVEICENKPDQSNYISLGTQVIDSLLAGKTAPVKFIFGALKFSAGSHDICFLADSLDKYVESDETNNEANFTMNVVTLADFIVTIEITPAAITLSADEEVAFTATGTGKDDQKYALKPTWSASGGGDIDTNGLYIANKVGDWKVHADLGTIQGKALVTVTSGAVMAIEIVEEKMLFAVGHQFQFTAVGYDTDGNIIDLTKSSLAWYVNGAVGTIDTSGLFKATAAGTGAIGADLQTDLSKLNDELAITVKDKIYIKKNYDVAGSNADYAIKIAFTKEGNVTFEELPEDNLSGEQITIETFGEYLDHIGVFVKIEIPVVAQWDWITIECTYDPAILPADVLEEDLVMFYFDEALHKWVKCEDTWVDTANNIVYANVTHLTIFAPMADSSAASDNPDDSGDDSGAGLSILMILGLVAVVFVIALAAGVIIVRKKKGKEEGKKGEAGDEKDMAPGEDETEEELVEREMVEDKEDDIEIIEDEDGDVNLAELEPMTKNCPGCKTAINVEPSYDEKVLLACPNCGKKGRMPNPYLADIERLRAGKQEMSESKDDDKLVSDNAESTDDEDIFADAKDDDELDFDLTD